MLEISPEEIRGRLEFDNPWWSGARDKGYRYHDLPRRFYFSLFKKLVCQREVNRAVVLMGPRRVGKTVLVHHVIHDLLDADTAADRLLYLSMETPVYTGLSLERLLRLYMEMHRHKAADQLYVFFDEIQYLKDWEVHLKSLVDSFPSIRFVVTGSAAAALRLKSVESGAGRFTDFILPPLTFAEYIHFIDKESLVDPVEEEIRFFVATDIDGLNQEFVNYLNYGGYPEAVFSKEVRENSVQFIKSDIIEKVLLRDLPSLYGIQDIQELNRLFTVLAYNTGNEVSIEALAKSSGVAKNTIRRYLEYLEAAFLIRRVNRIDINAQRMKRVTSFKVYLTNPSMRSALFGTVDSESPAMGALTETALFSQWMHSEAMSRLHYARWAKGEVDIVSLSATQQRPAWCLEVKWSDRHVRVTDELRAVAEFSRMHEASLEEPASVTTRTLRGQLRVQGVELQYVPSAEVIYTVGRNILRHKQLGR